MKMVKTPSKDDIDGTIKVKKDGSFEIPEEVDKDNGYSVMTKYKTTVYKGRSITYYNNQHPELEKDGKDYIRIKEYGGKEYYYLVDTTKMDD